jgi:hypothetical protein
MPRLIEIRMTKTTLYLTEPELVRLLAREPELWREAIRRGKCIQRARKRREGKDCELKPEYRPPF